MLGRPGTYADGNTDGNAYPDAYPDAYAYAYANADTRSDGHADANPDAGRSVHACADGDRSVPGQFGRVRFDHGGTGNGDGRCRKQRIGTAGLFGGQFDECKREYTVVPVRDDLAGDGHLHGAESWPAG